MTVKELIESLTSLPPEAQVIFEVGFGPEYDIVEFVEMTTKPKPYLFDASTLLPAGSVVLY